MQDEDQLSPSDTMKVRDEPKSSETVLDAIRQAQKTFQPYNDFCKRIDHILDAKSQLLGSAAGAGFTDQECDLFWSSMEILKPAIYAKPPRVVVSPRFKDGNSTQKTVAELLERVINSEFERADFDQVMLDVRDDLAIANRGVDWVTYESNDGKKVCIEHLDRIDFLHEPARKWSEVSWVARAAYMTQKQMADRFREASGQAYQDADFLVSREIKDSGATDDTQKAVVWEVWSKPDKKVYWVSEGVKVFLDESDEYLNLERMFPCPRPAFGSKQRRSLIPVPDYTRYELILGQINEATIKIYDLLKQVKVRGLIPAGGDVGTALETALSENTSAMFIPVPAAAFQAGATTGFISWVPIEQIATTITGLIQARQQLFDDFYQLSGISDIMRGATEADETLGAQRLKGQYGSVRVKDKIDELIRLCRDTACITGEIICDNFDQKTLLEIGQMEIPTKREVENSIKDLEVAGKRELGDLMDKAEEAAQQMSQQMANADPQQIEQAKAQAQQQLQQAQQQIVAKYAPQIKALESTVVIEDVMEIIKDRKTRDLIIDIETDSTVMIDEMAEKQSRAEFLTAFSTASQSVQPLLMAGEAGAKLAGAMLKFSLQPYNANRELDQLIDDFIEKAPELAAQQGEGNDNEGLVEAQKQLAAAEMEKAKAAIAKVEADSQLKQVELQRKMMEAQSKAQQDQQKMQLEAGKLELSFQKQQQDFETKIALMEAQIDKLRAETAKTLASIGFDARKQELDEYREANAQQQQQVDTAMALSAEGRAERGEERADRQQSVSEQQGQKADERADRQQELTERQVEMENANGSD